MLNFIIAILADTYTKLSKQSLGLYYDGLISRIAIFEDDKFYGGLIVGIPPFNTLALPILPFYLFVKDENKLRIVNDGFTKILFVPAALVETIVFFVLSIAIVPFAYLAAILNFLCCVFVYRPRTLRRVHLHSP